MQEVECRVRVEQAVEVPEVNVIESIRQELVAEYQVVPREVPMWQLAAVERDVEVGVTLTREVPRGYANVQTVEQVRQVPDHKAQVVQKQVPKTAQVVYEEVQVKVPMNRGLEANIIVPGSSVGVRDMGPAEIRSVSQGFYEERSERFAERSWEVPVSQREVQYTGGLQVTGGISSLPQSGGLSYGGGISSLPQSGNLMPGTYGNLQGRYMPSGNLTSEYVQTGNLNPYNSGGYVGNTMIGSYPPTDTYIPGTQGVIPSSSISVGYGV